MTQLSQTQNASAIGDTPLRRIILIILVAAVLLAGIGFGIYWYTNGRYLQHTDNAYVEADIAVIAPKISGYVAKVAVTDNQSVKRGDTLLELDPADYGATRDRLVTEVTRQQAAIGSATSTAAAQGATIAAAEAALASARAEAERAEADRNRYEKLLAERWVPRATYEQKVAEAASRQAAVAQAQANVAAARANRTAALSGEGGARAAKAGATAALESATLDLGNTVVRAPFDGVIGNRTVRVGQFVRVGQQVMVLVPLASVYVVANFKETQIGRMVPGQVAHIKVDAFPDAQVTGRVLSVSPAAGSRFSMLPPENATGNFTKIVQRVPVKIALDPLPAGLRLVPGMSVEAEIDVRGKPAS